MCETYGLLALIKFIGYCIFEFTPELHVPLLNFAEGATSFEFPLNINFVDDLTSTGFSHFFLCD